MKTIEEAAKENCEYNQYSLRQYDKYFIEAFKDGVKFAEKWIKTEEEKPSPRQMVLAKIDRGGGRNWTILAEFIPAKTVLADDFFEDYEEENMDYNEENDMYYVPETWVECSFFGTSYMFSEKVIEWRPIGRSLGYMLKTKT
jgi:hypothetical protein